MVTFQATGRLPRVVNNYVVTGNDAYLIRGIRTYANLDPDDVLGKGAADAIARQDTVRPAVIDSGRMALGVFDGICCDHCSRKARGTPRRVCKALSENSRESARASCKITGVSSLKPVLPRIGLVPMIQVASKKRSREREREYCNY